MRLSERVLCAGCGAPMPLEGSAAIMTCAFCSSQNHIRLRQRVVEPEATAPSLEVATVAPVAVEFLRWFVTKRAGTPELGGTDPLEWAKRWCRRGRGEW